jgi:hypothetical protein
MSDVGSLVLLGQGGCRLRGGSHGVEYQHWLLSPAYSADNSTACIQFCTSSDSCLGAEWDSSVPKCEAWLVVPAYAEPKPEHDCYVKIAPPSTGLPSAAVVAISISSGVVFTAAVMIMVVLHFRRSRIRRKVPAAPLPISDPRT